jgi:hypothetical protein
VILKTLHAGLQCWLDARSRVAAYAKFYVFLRETEEYIGGVLFRHETTLPPGKRADQIHRIQDDARPPIVHNCVTVYVTSFAIWRKRRQLLNHRHGKRLKSLLPPRRKRSRSGVFLSQSGRQTPDRVIAAQKSAILRPEISGMFLLSAMMLVIPVIVVTIFALVFPISFVIMIEVRNRARDGGRRQNAREKYSSFHFFSWGTKFRRSDFPAGDHYRELVMS